MTIYLSPLWFVFEHLFILGSPIHHLDGGMFAVNLFPLYPTIHVQSHSIYPIYVVNTDNIIEVIFPRCVLQ